MNGHTTTSDPDYEIITENKINTTLPKIQRPASMYETREGLRKPPICNNTVSIFKLLLFLIKIYFIFIINIS